MSRNMLLTEKVLQDIRTERWRQEAKFPDQQLRLGTGLRTVWLSEMLLQAREINDNHHAEELALGKGRASWASVLAEEFGEALTESDLTKVREEMVQVASVAVRIVENIDAGKLLE